MMLSGRNTTTDKITGLDVGADDYLSKPYSYDELAARLRTLLRRPVERESELIKVGDLVLNPLARQLFLGTSEIKLLRKEFDLIEVLMRNPQQAYSSAALLRLLWPNDNEPNPDVLFTCIRRLRKKIDKPGEPSLISLVHGLGYRMRV